MTTTRYRKIYILTHTNHSIIISDAGKYLGAFSSKKNLEKAIEFYRYLPGFSNIYDSYFEIREFYIDRKADSYYHCYVVFNEDEDNEMRMVFEKQEGAGASNPSHPGR